MQHEYIKLAHSNPTHEDWFVVNWCLGNTCNFECSYCPDDLHSGSIKWPEIEQIKQFMTRVAEQVAPRKVYYELWHTWSFIMAECEATDFIYPMKADIYYPIITQNNYGKPKINIIKTSNAKLWANIRCSFSYSFSRNLCNG